MILLGQILKTHCKNGHERYPANLTPSGNCRMCARLYEVARNFRRYTPKRARFAPKLGEKHRPEWVNPWRPTMSDGFIVMQLDPALA